MTSNAKVEDESWCTLKLTRFGSVRKDYNGTLFQFPSSKWKTRPAIMEQKTRVRISSANASANDIFAATHSERKDTRTRTTSESRMVVGKLSLYKRSKEVYSDIEDAIEKEWSVNEFPNAAESNISIQTDDPSMEKRTRLKRTKRFVRQTCRRICCILCPCAFAHADD
ncbi:uncharacterized protein LOC134180545 [Corticium candelabrum]|uniref:uncharacterized protein LOC134180545 n=1 Tax=Corticium candelabrum TaxID=121492 RepID=UPI002E25BF3A|nr:uncharacterized protein LOC134180545 [Corticium candelabrum]